MKIVLIFCLTEGQVGGSAIVFSSSIRFYDHVAIDLYDGVI